MNKKLIAVAVAGALAAPLAALADVTIYGKVHMSLDYYLDSLSPSLADDDDDDDDESDSGLAVSSNFSRIGFRGSEDLGEDLKAIWQVEQEVDLDDGAGEWASRNSFLGLASGFGTVLVGRHDSPFKDVGRQVDIFGDTVGDIRALTDQAIEGVIVNPITGVASTVSVSPGWDERLNNIIAYISPDFAGLKFFGAYSADINANGTVPDNSDTDAWSASLTYQTGPIFAAVAYEQHDTVFLNVATGEVNDDSENAFRVAAGFTFDAFRVGGMWQRTDGFIRAGSDEQEKRDVFDIFGQFAFGATSIGLQWTWADSTDLQDPLTGRKLDDGAQLYSIGLFHNLSKRTQVYGMYSYMNNDDDSSFAIGGGGGHGEAYVGGIDNDGEVEDPSVFSVGVIHTF
jgi:predicted porin